MVTWNIKKPTNVFETSLNYIVGNVSYPRVTSILNVISKPYLYRWYGKYGAEYCQQVIIQSLELGKIVHALVEDTLNEVSIDLKGHNEDVQGCFKAFEKWRQCRTIGYRKTEVFLYSRKYCYAGTADLIAEINNAVGVVDYKTSKNIYSENFLQVAAYLVAFQELTNVTPDFGGVLRLGKTGEYEYCEFSYETAKEFFHFFLSALELWKWQQQDWNTVVKRETGVCCNNEAGTEFPANNVHEVHKNEKKE